MVLLEATHSWKCYIIAKNIFTNLNPKSTPCTFVLLVLIFVYLCARGPTCNYNIERSSPSKNVKKKTVTHFFLAIFGINFKPIVDPKHFSGGCNTTV